MALNKAGLEARLLATFTNLSTNKTAADAAREIADAIDIFVKSGTVISNGATAPTVSGSPAAITSLPGVIT